MPLPQNILNRVLHRRETVKVQFLTRPGCHLCDVAEPLVLREFGAENVEALNILEHPRLESEFVFRIPVILYEGKVIAEGAADRRDVHLARREALRQLRDSRTTQ